MTDSPSSSRASRLAAGSMRASAATTIGVPWRAMVFQEAGDVRDAGGGLGGVALVAADFQRELGSIDQWADRDLRIDAALLGITDFAQVVLGFGFEIQRRHAVEQQAEPAAVGGASEVLLGDRTSVVPGPHRIGMLRNCAVGQRVCRFSPPTRRRSDYQLQRNGRSPRPLCCVIPRGGQSDRRADRPEVGALSFLEDRPAALSAGGVGASRR